MFFQPLEVCVCLKFAAWIPPWESAEANETHPHFISNEEI